MSLQTEFEFVLPLGYVDERGNLHRQGVMRLANAMDEIEPLTNLRVRSNQAYLTVVLLARVIVSLGTLPEITPAIIERMFAADLAYLQALYRSINETGKTTFKVACPHCREQHEVDLIELGGL